MTQNNKDDNEKQKLTTRTVILIGAIAFVVLNFTVFINFIKYLFGAISPLIIGAGIAFVLNILVSRYENIYFPKSMSMIVKKTRRSICVILSILTVILVLLFLLYIVIPQISQFIHLLTTELPGIYEKSIDWIIKHSERYPIIRERLEQIDINGEAATNRVLELLNRWAFGSMSFIGIMFTKIVELFLAFIFSIYILLEKDILKNNFNKLLNAYAGRDLREKLLKVIKISDDTFSGFFLGQFKEAIILGLLCTVGMFILDLPYAPTVGTVVGLTAVVPIVGPYLGAIVSFLLVAIVDLFKALLFIVFIVILQQVEGNFIYPRVVGKNIGLPAIWVLAAIIVGGGLMGIMGIVIGVPIAATIYKLLRRHVNEKIG